VLWRDHRLFTIAAGLSLLPRLVAALGFKPALLIQDSFSYMQHGVQLYPLGRTRPEGYSLLLWGLKPFHSLLLVTTLQHLMGIALAVIVYGVLRHRGLPAWGRRWPPRRRCSTRGRSGWNPRSCPTRCSPWC
jgi:hypothetical protein